MELFSIRIQRTFQLVSTTICFSKKLIRIQIGIIEKKIIKVILATSERKAIPPYFLVIGKHDTIII